MHHPRFLLTSAWTRGLPFFIIGRTHTRTPAPPRPLSSLPATSQRLIACEEAACREISSNGFSTKGLADPLTNELANACTPSSLRNQTIEYKETIQISTSWKLHAACFDCDTGSNYNHLQTEFVRTWLQSVPLSLYTCTSCAWQKCGKMIEMMRTGAHTIKKGTCSFIKELFNALIKWFFIDLSQKNHWDDFAVERIEHFLWSNQIERVQKKNTVLRED